MPSRPEDEARQPGRVVAEAAAVEGGTVLADGGGGGAATGFKASLGLRGASRGISMGGDRDSI